VGLIQAALEHAGIATVSVTMLEEVTRAVRPPRALFVDTPLGYPLGRPHDPVMQTRIMCAALDLLAFGAGPVLAGTQQEDGLRGKEPLAVLRTRKRGPVSAAAGPSGPLA
jgi:D-proline reductase (dithiol) PrdB